MGLIFIAAGAVLGLTAVYVLTSRSAVHAALAGQNTQVGLHDPAAETLSDGGNKAAVHADWQLTPVDSLTDAEELLDCLEAHGHAERELVVLGNSSFVVRWR